MDAAEMMIERLQEQIQLAPSLTENDVPGGTVEDLCNRLVEGMNHAHEVKRLQAVEAGVRRYGKHLRDTLEKVQKLKPIFAEVAPVRDAIYANQQAKDKATARMKERVGEIETICKGAIQDLHKALSVLEEGDGKMAKLAGSGVKV